MYFKYKTILYTIFFINYNLYLYSTHINDRNIKIYLFINKTHLLNTKQFFINYK